MKVLHNVRNRRAAGGKRGPAAIIMAALLLAGLALPGSVRSAYAADTAATDGTYTLTVMPGSSDIMSSLAAYPANIVVDLYQVTDDTETFTEPFADLTLPMSSDNSAWQETAQKAADVVLGTAPSGQTEWDPSASTAEIADSLKSEGNEAGQTGAVIEGLNSGIWLVIAHGSDVEAYASTDTSAAATTGSTTNTTNQTSNGTVTIANSTMYQYKFSPELIRVPAEAAVTLKPAQSTIIGRLAIQKDLLTYEQRWKEADGTTRQSGDETITDPATFIFEVSVYSSKEAYESAKTEDAIKAARIFHDYVSITFDSYGSKTVYIDNLPIGAYAVVTEEYSARAYTTDVTPAYSDSTQLIPANGTLTVVFENDYDGTNSGGGSVTNKFTYSTTNAKWGWQQVSDDSEDGTVIQSDGSGN